MLCIWKYNGRKERKKERQKDRKKDRQKGRKEGRKDKERKRERKRERKTTLILMWLKSLMGKTGTKEPQPKYEPATVNGHVAL